MTNLSVIVLTHNDEKMIERVINSLTFASEVIVIDDFSKDSTISIAKKNGARVFQRKLGGNFSEQRNFGLMKANSEWVLFIDSDEIVSEELKNEILDSITNSTVNGFFLRRIDIMWGKRLTHGEIGNLRLLRLARKDVGKFEGMVHEEWEIEGKTGELNNPIIHYPHESLKEFLKEINTYSSLRANELYKRKMPVSVVDIICYPVGKFILNFFIRLGIKDGIAGFLFAISMSFHSFLVRSKLWQLYNEKKDLSTN